MKDFLFLGFFISILYSCSPKIGSEIIAKQAALADTAFVLVLQKEDNFINDGVEIGTIKSVDNGLSTNCSYYEVIDKLRQLARQNGANVIKITEHKKPDVWSSCVRLWGTMYSVANYKKHETEIEWSAKRRLTWDDFKGSPVSYYNTNIAAQTYCSMGFQTNYLTAFSKSKIFTKNSFTCSLSWVKPDQKNRPELLEHEQAHFDLCEVYTRQLRKKLVEKKLNNFNFAVNADLIFHEVHASYETRQGLFDKETKHGLNLPKQTEWLATISKELDELQEFAN